MANWRMAGEAGEVITRRLGLIGAAAARGRRSVPEFPGFVIEKQQAMFESWLSLWGSGARVWMNPWPWLAAARRGRPSNAVISQSLSAFDGALHPYRRRVRGNVKRLRR